LFPESVSLFRKKIQNLKMEAEKLRREWEGSRDKGVEADLDGDAEMGG
jgi:hypothetical protein